MRMSTANSLTRESVLRDGVEPQQQCLHSHLHLKGRLRLHKVTAAHLVEQFNREFRLWGVRMFANKDHQLKGSAIRAHVLADHLGIDSQHTSARSSAETITENFMKSQTQSGLALLHHAFCRETNACSTKQHCDRYSNTVHGPGWAPTEL